MELADVILPRDIRSHEEGTKPCIVYNEKAKSVGSLRYSDARKGLNAHSQWLKSVVGKDKDSVVAYMSINSVDLFVSTLACTCSDVPALPALLNTRWTSSEIAEALSSPIGTRSETIILHSPEFEDVANKAASMINHNARCLQIPQLTNGSHASDDDSGFVRPEPPGRRSPDAYSDEVAIILFTSGTSSGSSKGVCLSHRALCVQCNAKVAPPCSLSSSSRFPATTVPWFHVGGFTNILATWLARGTLILPSLKKTSGSTSFDPEWIWNTVKGQSAANTLVLVPVMLYALQEYSQRFPHEKYEHVDFIMIGGQSASPRMIAFCRRTFPRARIVQTYACTEAASSLTYFEIQASPPNTRTKISGDCVGSPPPHVQLRLVSNDTENVNSPYVLGRISTRGPHVMNGYWKRGVATPASDESWFETNDLGFWDERGVLWYSGRLSDVIRSGGETVGANEVERVLLRHQGILECAVFGLPDEKYGEVVCCALVVSPNEALPTVIQQWCTQNGLAGYKRPRRVFRLPRLPRNTSGKVLKFKLKETFSDQRCLPRAKL